MKLKQPLTKENFWNKISVEFPKSFKVFSHWIDDYKESVNWQVLFNPHFKVVEEPTQIHSTPKYHDLPYAIQQGIWIEFVNYIFHERYHINKNGYNIVSLDFEFDVRFIFKNLEVFENHEKNFVADYYWTTDYFHNDNSFTMDDYLDNQMNDEATVYFQNGSYAEISLYGHKYAVQACGNGDGYNHHVKLTMIKTLE